MAQPLLGAAAMDAMESIVPHWATRRDRGRIAASVPQTSAERLMEQDCQPEPSDKALPRDESRSVLYLAYGSNLSAETFLGNRGIRPISQVNVSVPTLQLSFNLPGLAYQEPCFANVAFRKLPEKPKLPDDPRFPTPLPPSPPFNPSDYSQGQWDGGLIGVVYEVTKEDYRQIILTEGGGAGYKEIVVPCVPLVPKASYPGRPPLPEIPKVIVARTLYAPYIPDGGGDQRHRHGCWKKLLGRPSRPDPDYAQASARYLKLITDGAREHDLPYAYQTYLQSLQPYTITSIRQNIGRIISLAIFVPLLLGLMQVAAALADEDGKSPPMVVALLNALFSLHWAAHDYIFKPVFGDGERTEEKQNVQTYRLSANGPLAKDEEKAEWEGERGGDGQGKTANMYIH